MEKRNTENKILVTRSSMPSYEEYIAEIRDIWDSHHLTNMGPKHEKLRAQLKEYLGAEGIELFTNGHMALELTLQSFHLEGEVITTPFTFASTVHAIVRNGLTPVFCDINPDDYTIDADKIEDLITERTCAILPVHVYGNICDTEKIQAIAERHQLAVIYDAAHTFGETYKGKSLAGYGDAACYSFHATKVFNTIEGGASCYKNPEIGQRLYDLKNFGIHGPEEIAAVGANAKMNEFCAAMGLCNLRHIEEELEKRSKVDAEYRKYLSGVPGITLNTVQPEVKHNYCYFPILIDAETFGQNRNQVLQKLQANGIFTRKYFYPLASEFSAYSDRYNSMETPVAVRVSEQVLTLPMYGDLALEDIQKICEYILER